MEAGLKPDPPPAHALMRRRPRWSSGPVRRQSRYVWCSPSRRPLNALGVGRTVMYALVSSGAVESVRIGRLRRVPADALVTFLDQLPRPSHSDGAA